MAEEDGRDGGAPLSIIADVLELDLSDEVSGHTIRSLAEKAAEQIIVALADRGYVIRRHEDV